MGKRNKHKQTGGNQGAQAVPESGVKGSRLSKIMLVIGILLIAGGGILFFAQPVSKTGAVEMVVYKSPTCNCCGKWVAHMRDAGFKVTTKNIDDLDGIKSFYGIAPALRSCHTAVVEGYLVEGHVPAADIKRLLQERPAVAGLAVPGMPMGSPGMEGEHQDPYNVLTFDKDGRTSIYASY